MGESEKCVICASDANISSEDYDNKLNYKCIRCGSFSLFISIEGSINELTILQKSSLSHYIRIKNQIDKIRPRISEEIIEELIPIRPFVQAENLITFLGENTKTPGEYYRIGIGDAPKESGFLAVVGITIDSNRNNLNYILDGCRDLGYIDQPEAELKSNQYDRMKLTFNGWKKYDELKKKNIDSNVAFMAMKFKPEISESCDPPYSELEEVYKYFRQEVKKAGFELKNDLAEAPKGGLIDAHLELEIRRSKFIVADLSHNNNGAYWEAGFAHGLGKKVFYTCKKGVEPHFDTSHHQTIPWEVGKEQEAAEKLKDTIRNTLFESSSLND